MSSVRGQGTWERTGVVFKVDEIAVARTVVAIGGSCGSWMSSSLLASELLISLSLSVEDTYWV